MNTVGWLGGALGPVAVGFATQYGRHPGDEAANLSDAIAAGSLVYVIGAVLVVAAAVVFSGRGGGRA